MELINSAVEHTYNEAAHAGSLTLTYNPYNSKNVEITLNDVQSILTAYGLPPRVRNLQLYRRAFVHKSYTKKPTSYNEERNISLSTKPDDCLPLRTKCNERLEFLGDGVLECITKYYLYKRFPKEDEGFMTEKKIALVKNEHIGRVAMSIGLNRWLILSRNAEEKNTRNNIKKLGCLFEAFLGALFLDFNGMTIQDNDDFFGKLFLTGPGFQMSQVFIEHVFDKHVNWSNIIHLQDNYKNILQEYFQKIFKVTPIYIIHNKEPEYEMGVYIYLTKDDDTAYDIASAMPFHMFGCYQRINTYYQEHGRVFVFLASGTHKIKKKAEQLACKKALELLEVNLGGGF